MFLTMLAIRQSCSDDVTCHRQSVNLSWALQTCLKSQEIGEQPHGDVEEDLLGGSQDVMMQYRELRNTERDDLPTEMENHK